MEEQFRDSTEIGPFRMLNVLGEGGMGIVYAAEQRKPIFRRVALKVIKIGMDTKEVLARFDAERQALALLDHPNIAKVLDAGATSEGRPYFAMELVKGLSITRYCDEGRLSVRERVEIFIQACTALQHAHERGILHRDIKPTNLLVTEIDEKPVVKVIDFGLAKATNQRLTERTLFTEEGRIIGTPEYMSPEQAETTARDVDARSDVFSLGVVLYELLAGGLPFDFKSVRAKGYFEVQRFIREEEPPTPRRRLSSLKNSLDQILALRRCRLQELAASLRNGLDAITMKAIAKARRDRYQSCSDLAADLRRFFAGEAVLARRASLVGVALQRVRRFQRRHPAVVPTLLFATLTAVGMWWALRGAHSDPAASSTVATTTTQPAPSRLTRGMDADATIRLATFADELRGKGETARALDLYRVVALELRQVHGDEDSRVAPVIHKAGVCLQSLARFDEALVEFESVLAMQQQVSGREDDEAAVAAVFCSAACLQALGRKDEALERFRFALAMLGRVHREGDHEDVACAMDNVAACMRDCGRAKEADDMSKEAVAMRARMQPDEYRRLLGVVETANSLLKQWHLVESLRQFEEALRLCRRVYGAGDHEEIARIQGQVAVCLRSLGRGPEAHLRFHEQLTMLRRLYPDGRHADVAECLNNLGLYLESLGRGSEAISFFEEALAINLRLHGETDGRFLDFFRRINGAVETGRDTRPLAHVRKVVAGEEGLTSTLCHPDVAESMTNLAHSLRSAGRDLDALVNLQSASTILTRLHDDRDHPEVASILDDLGACLHSLRDEPEAMVQFEKALAMRTRLYADHDHPDVAVSLENVGSARLRMNRAEEALGLYRDCAAMRQRMYGKRDHPDVAKSLCDIGSALLALGSRQDALSSFKLALAMQQRLFADKDHVDVAKCLVNTAFCLEALGRATEAAPLRDRAAAMRRRLRR